MTKNTIDGPSVVEKPRVGFSQVYNIIAEHCLHVVKVLLHRNILHLALSVLTVLFSGGWVGPDKEPNVHQDLADILALDLLKNLARERQDWRHKLGLAEEFHQPARLVQLLSAKSWVLAGLAVPKANCGGQETLSKPLQVTKGCRVLRQQLQKPPQDQILVKSPLDQ